MKLPAALPRSFDGWLYDPIARGFTGTQRRWLHRYGFIDDPAGVYHVTEAGRAPGSTRSATGRSGCSRAASRSMRARPAGCSRATCANATRRGGRRGGASTTRTRGPSAG